MNGITCFFIICLFGLSYSRDGCVDRGCIFNGETYKEGDSLRYLCFHLTCIDEVWRFTRIDEINCDRCVLDSDPHFNSFDNRHYDWFGKCNYSLAQPVMCEKRCSYDPPFAVYADFRDCNNGASCVDCTTYKIDPNTAVTIKHEDPTILDINGNTFFLDPIPSAVSDCYGNFYPAIVWTSGYCAYVVGNEFSIEACRDVLFIYTSKANLRELVGLCGYYSGNQDDDYVPRGSCFNPIVLPEFAISWQTQVQNEDCKKDEEYEIYKKSLQIEEACSKDEHYPICEEQIKWGYRRCFERKEINEETFNEAIENCVVDCCFNPDACDEWANIARQIAEIECETEVMEDRKNPPK